MKKLVLIVTLIVFCLSCKGNSKEKINKPNTNQENMEVIESPKLQVLINAKVLENDVFEVYFYELGQETFHSQDFVYTKVVGKPENQDITFTLPDKIYPERLRLDFGKIKTQKAIKLNTIKILYGNEEYVFSNEEIKNEFKSSKYLDFNKDNFILTPKEIEGRYDPYLYSKKVSSIINYLVED